MIRYRNVFSPRNIKQRPQPQTTDHMCGSVSFCAHDLIYRALHAMLRLNTGDTGGHLLLRW